MKNKTMILHTRQLTLGLALVAAAGSASATTWTFSNVSTGYNKSTGVFGEATVVGFDGAVSSGINGTATAWANTVGSTNVLLANAYLTPQSSSGLGITYNESTDESTTSPDHAIDNVGRKESVLFSFSEKVNLTNSYFGWIDTDSDFSVYAYTGTGVGTVANFRYGETATYTNELTDNGWTLVGNYAEASQTNNSGDDKSFGNSIYSSYWLIGAYNGSGADSTGDYFKLKTVSGVKYTPPCTNGNCGGGTTGQAPEPGTLLLMGAGLLGLRRINARRAVRNAV